MYVQTRGEESIKEDFYTKLPRDEKTITKGDVNVQVQENRTDYEEPLISVPGNLVHEGVASYCVRTVLTNRV